MQSSAFAWQVLCNGPLVWSSEYIERTQRIRNCDRFGCDNYSTWAHCVRRMELIYKLCVCVSIWASSDKGNETDIFIELGLSVYIYRWYNAYMDQSERESEWDWSWPSTTNLLESSRIVCPQAYYMLAGRAGDWCENTCGSEQHRWCEKHALKYGASHRRVYQSRSANTGYHICGDQLSILISPNTPMSIKWLWTGVD